MFNKLAALFKSKKGESMAKEQQVYETPIIVKDRKERPEPIEQKPAPSIKQFELSDGDVEYLGSNQYSDVAWTAIGRKHGVDETTREPIANTRSRAFLAAVKVWAPLPSEAGTIATTKSLNAGVYVQAEPIPADKNAIRAEMAKRDLTKPTSPETKIETIAHDYAEK